ncbi:MAG: YfbR-like 5'-deoxynucleotidase [Rhizobiaceae bacterium]
MAKTDIKTRAWQRMLSGRVLDLIEPSPVDIEIEDIAHGLARVARWNGQTHGEHAYSVAQHSVAVLHVARTLNPAISKEQQLMTLLHDAPEYVIGDMISPFKAVLGDGYKSVEQRLLTAIHLRFGLPSEASMKQKKNIKRADSITAFHEATRLAGFETSEALKLFGRPGNEPLADEFLEPVIARRAQELFLDAFYEIGEIS